MWWLISAAEAWQLNHEHRKELHNDGDENECYFKIFLPLSQQISPKKTYSRDLTACSHWPKHSVHPQTPKSTIFTHRTLLSLLMHHMYSNCWCLKMQFWIFLRSSHMVLKSYWEIEILNHMLILLKWKKWVNCRWLNIVMVYKVLIWTIQIWTMQYEKIQRSDMNPNMSCLIFDPYSYTREIRTKNCKISNCLICIWM